MVSKLEKEVLSLPYSIFKIDLFIFFCKKGNVTSNYELEFSTASGEIRYLLVNVSYNFSSHINFVISHLLKNFFSLT